MTAFLRALNRSIKEVIANPDEGIRSLKAHDPLVDVALETQRLKLCLDFFVATTNLRQASLGAINKVRLDHTIEQVVAAFGIKSPVSPEGTFDSRFLPAAADRRL